MAKKRATHSQGPVEPEDVSQEVPDIDEMAPHGAALPPPKRRPPIHTIRRGKIRAAIWENWTEFGPVYNVTLSRLYRDHQQQWQQSESFGLGDLLLLAKVIDLAHDWISEHIQADGDL